MSIARPALFVGDLPAGRRETLLWRLSALPEFRTAQPLDAFDDLCGLSAGPWAADRALADGCGMYHLFAGERSVCCGGISRSRWCEGQVRGAGAEPVFDVPNVPLEQRCDRAANRWPPPIGGAVGRRSELRQRLVEKLGTRCATCPEWGRVIDHDHLTGLVRGYLCGSCNTIVDLCRHVSGCRFADYLTEPPALALAVLYPGWQRLLAHPRHLPRMQRFQTLVREIDSAGPRVLPEEPHRRDPTSTATPGSSTPVPAS